MDKWFYPVENLGHPFVVIQRKHIGPVEIQVLQQRRQPGTVQDESHEAGRFPRLKIVIVVAVSVQQTEIALFGGKSAFAAPEPQLPLHDVFDGEKRLMEPPDVAELVPQHEGTEGGIERRAWFGGEVFPVPFNPFVLSAGVDDISFAVIPLDGDLLIQKRR